MTDTKPKTKDELARQLLIAAQAIYSAEAKGGREASEARARHAALLAEYEGTSATTAPTRGPSAASPSGVPWCSERCDADGRLIPGR
ncbi:hypothetical protein [Roseateles sp.]|uniref:hypothetical protein n=1 Tax=Roseateles sp. TaxID=1971397 RepID=UPI002E015B91|nr:hypothetical protein [Roseateles sp.]